MGKLSGHLREEFLKGIAQFNARQFFDCHESLEAVWQEYLETDREFIQGIIQIAVAYYHLEKGNYLGANKLLSRGLPRVKKYESLEFDLNMENFVAKVEEDYLRLENDSCPPIVQFHMPEIQIIGPPSDC